MVPRNQCSGDTVPRIGCPGGHFAGRGGGGGSNKSFHIDGRSA